MRALLIQRVIRLVITLLAVSFLSFFMVNLLPGDPALQILPADSITAESIARVHEDLGLDDPLPVRYFNWLGNAVRGDLGQSYLKGGQEVSDILRARIPVTLELALVAVAVSLLIAIPLGAFSAYREGAFLDRVLSSSALGMLSVPVFVAAVFLIWIFAVKLQWLPATGWVRLTNDPVLNAKHVILPAMSLAFTEIAVYTRLIRADMISTLQEDFVFTAKAKGISDRRVLFRHALRPSSLSLITVVGLNAGALLGGTVVVETLFAMPGIGRSLLEAITQRDFLLIQGIVLFLSVVYVVVNFAVDLIYLVVDPRIRHARALA